MPSKGPGKILFVINRRSGRKKKTDRQQVIRDFVAGHRLDAEFFEMPRHDCRERLREIIARVQPDTVVAVGGDGTVSLVAQMILGQDKKMGIVPAGSANGMARELEIPEDTVEALKIILAGSYISSDLVSVNNEWLCMHLSDIGLNARVVKYFQEGPVRGFAGYTLALWKAIRRNNQLKITLYTREGTKTVGAIMVLFANASKYGTGATINHECNLMDGLFEVVIVKKIGPAEIWKMFFGQRGFNPKNIELHHATRVTVETRRPSHLQVDGEYVGKVTSVEAKILTEKLDVFVPEKKLEVEAQNAMVAENR